MPTDTERLDWLTLTEADIEHTRSLVVLSWSPTGKGLQVRVSHDLRDAIDSAMAQEGGE